MSVELEDSIISFNNHSSVSGYTETYESKLVYYIKTPYFEKAYGISRKTLIRYKQNIIKNEVEDQHKFYFIKKNGAYWYSVSMLNFKSYKKSDKHAEILPENVEIGFGTRRLKSVYSEFFKGLLSIPWDYACGANYEYRKERDQCVEKMKSLYGSLKKQYPKTAITFYYTTEFQNNTYHNHFMFSFSGKDKSKIKRQLENNVRKLGTRIPDVEPYEHTGVYLQYITKDVHENPDGWGVITNYSRDAQLLEAA